MRADFLKPKALSIDAMSSRLKIMINYLNSFPSLDKKSLSQGEMIEIVLIMLFVVWLSSMATADLNPRESFMKT